MGTIAFAQSNFYLGFGSPNTYNVLSNTFLEMFGTVYEEYLMYGMSLCAFMKPIIIIVINHDCSINMLMITYICKFKIALLGFKTFCA